VCDQVRRRLYFIGDRRSVTRWDPLDPPLRHLLICGFSVRFRGGSPSFASLSLVSPPRLQASWLRASRSPNMLDSEAAHHFLPRYLLPVASGLRQVLSHWSMHSHVVAVTAPSTRYALRHRDRLSEADEDMANTLPTGPRGRSARSGAPAWNGGVDHAVETYQQSTDGWCRDTPVYDAAAAERHWKTLLALFAARCETSSRKMTLTLRIVGGSLLFVGTVWFLQGINVLPGSFMSGQPRWAVNGGIAGSFGHGVVDCREPAPTVATSMNVLRDRCG